MSDQNYFLFTNKLGLTGSGWIPCKTVIVEKRQEINKIILEKYKIKVNKHEVVTLKNKVKQATECICVHVDISQVISDLKIVADVTKPFIKFSYDGAATGLVVVINLR